LIFAAAAIVLVATNAALGCVCNIRSLSKRVRESRNVFVGTILDRTQISPNGLWVNRFAVERYWKGVRSANLIVYTTSDDCAPSCAVGGKYLVFAYFVKEASHLETDACMRTARVEMVADDLAKLGKSKIVAKRSSYRKAKPNKSLDASGGSMFRIMTGPVALE